MKNCVSVYEKKLEQSYQLRPRSGRIDLFVQFFRPTANKAIRVGQNNSVCQT